MKANRARRAMRRWRRSAKEGIRRWRCSAVTEIVLFSVMRNAGDYWRVGSM